MDLAELDKKLEELQAKKSEPEHLGSYNVFAKY